MRIFLAIAVTTLAVAPLLAREPAPSTASLPEHSFTAAEHSSTAAKRSSTADHGRLEWFPGTFEQALEKAKKENKIVFVDFWASWCGWCKRFDLEVLSDAVVLAESRELVCLVVDAESEAGAPLAARYGASNLPALVFVEPDGSLRERLSGFRPAPQFVQEIRRIRANEGTLGEIEKKLAANADDVPARLELVLRLRRMHDPRWEAELKSARDRIARGVGFDPKSPDDRFVIGRKLRLCGDEKGYQEQLSAIRTLDPEGQSDPMRRLALNTLVEGVNARYRNERVFDPSPIQSFLAEEKSPLVLFEGYSMLYGMATFQAEDALRRGQTGIASEKRSESREYARRAWKHCPPDRLASFGREITQDFLAEPQLAEPTLPFLLEVATQASQAAPRSADHLELLGQCLEKAGKPAEARAAYERALEIERSKESVRRKLEALDR